MFDLSGTMVCDRNPLSHLPKPINPIFHKSNNPIWGEASKYLYRPCKKLSRYARRALHAMRGVITVSYWVPLMAASSFTKVANL